MTHNYYWQTSGSNPESSVPWFILLLVIILVVYSSLPLNNVNIRRGIFTYALSNTYHPMIKVEERSVDG